MNIVHITAGAGGMYCGICLRDNALVAALRKMGHEVLMIPLYLPLTLDEEDQSAGTPIFFSGINVYLEQKSALFREAPAWLRNLTSSRGLLKWAGSKAAKTKPQDLGELTLSMLRGEEGFQARELVQLISWLKLQGKPDVICLSNALLIGLARKLKAELRAPVVCMLQGEDAYLDALPPAQRSDCWRTLAERSNDVELFGAASGYFGQLMAKRLGLASERVRVVYNGINLEGYTTAQSGFAKETIPVLGYFARMCREKGLDTLVEAYILLRQRNRVKGLLLRIGGGCGPGDEPFAHGLRELLKRKGLEESVEFHPNLDRNQKMDFLRGLNVFSVPARCGEAFGLYVIESLAASVPVVQPRSGAFPELIELTGGGLLCEPENPESLADKIEELLMNPSRAKAMGSAGREEVLAKFSAQAMANSNLAFYQEAQLAQAVASK